MPEPTLAANHVPGVLWLSQELHNINILEMTKNERRAQARVDEINKLLHGSHIQVIWDYEAEEWCLKDTLLFEREESEDLGGVDNE